MKDPKNAKASVAAKQTEANSQKTDGRNASRITQPMARLIRLLAQAAVRESAKGGTP